MAEKNFSKDFMAPVFLTNPFLEELIQKQQTTHSPEERKNFFQLLQKILTTPETHEGTEATVINDPREEENSSLIEALCQVESPVPSDTILSPSQSDGYTPTSLELRQKRNAQDRYKILETLPSPGIEIMQHVYDQFLNRKVTLKKAILNTSEGSPSFLAQKKLVEQIRKEAHITSILEHPNIVPLYDFIEKQNEEIYFTTRKIPGKSLRELLLEFRQSSSFDEAKVLSIYLKICDAVRYAHARGFIHRNLKPEHIRLGSFGEVYVTHWNLAKKLEETHDYSPECTTAFALEEQFSPGYAPPEQIQDRNRAEITADVYALGKILRECFTLLSPAEEQAHILATKNQKEESCFLSAYCDPMERKIPTEIRNVIKKATQEDPRQRYDSIEQLALAIELYQKNICILVQEYRPFEGILKRIRGILERFLPKNRDKQR